MTKRSYQNLERQYKLPYFLLKVMRKRRECRMKAVIVWTLHDLQSSVGREIGYIKSQDSSVSDWLTLRVSHFKRRKFRIKNNQSKIKTVSREVRTFISLFKDRFLIG